MTALLIGIALAYWLWYGLTQRSITGDDGISILAAQGILEHGYQRLPSGFIYYRGFVPNYLMAASIWAFGFNNFAILFPSLLMGLGSLILAYLFARDVLGRSLVGLASVAFLIALDAQTFYATSPRMYMSLQFFTILAAYSGWRGYVNGEVKFQSITVLAVAGAFLCHQQGALLLVAIPASILAVRWIQGNSRVHINHSLAIISLLLLWIAFSVLHWSPLPDTLPVIASGAGAGSDVLGINTDIFLWAKHIGWLERTVPFSIILAPMLLFLFYQATRERYTQKSQGLIYAGIILILSGLAVGTITRTSQVRFWLFLVPIYVPLLVLSVSVLGEQLKESRAGQIIPLWRRPLFRVAGVTGWAIVVFFVAHFAYSRLAYVNIVAEGFGRPCTSQITDCTKLVKEQYSALRSVVKENDLLISSNPWVTSYYLGRVDFYFRERIVSGSFTSFDNPTDEYFGIPFMDSQEKILEMANSDRRVWVFSDFKARLFVNEDALELLDDTFDTYDHKPLMTVYVNH